VLMGWFWVSWISISGSEGSFSEEFELVGDGKIVEIGSMSSGSV
jgi:hypothetical protein